MIDYTAWRFWIDAGVMLMVAANTVYTWWSNREKVTRKRFEEHSARIAALEFESRTGGCPQHGDLVKRMDEMHGEMKELIGTVRGMNRAVDLMNEFLIRQGGKQ